MSDQSLSIEPQRDALGGNGPHSPLAGPVNRPAAEHVAPAGHDVERKEPSRRPATNNESDASPAGVTLEGQDGSLRRVDRPHDEDFTGADQPPEGADAGLKSTLGERRDDELLFEASQIAQRLRTQFAELDEHETRLNSLGAQLDERQRDLEAERRRLADEAHEQSRNLNARQAEFDHKVATCQKLISELEEQQHVLTAAREQLDAERDNLRRQILDELDEERSGIESDRQALDEDRTRHEHEYNTRHEQLRSEHEQLARQLQQERATFESRMRFQQEHLEKLRGELESARAEFAGVRQAALQKLNQDESLVELRRQQLDQRHALLAERERSLVREHESLAELRRSLEQESEQQRERLLRERESWGDQRQAQRAELDRQQNVLTLHADNLEGRRSRLERLRAELEETHRQTLQTRLAVEEAWAQFSQAAGGEVVQARVDEARQALAEHFSRLRESLNGQREETAQAESALHRHKDGFREERDKLADWIAQRDENLRLWEEQLRRDTGQLDARESAWQSARDEWLQEKIGAEHVIRDLLRQLSELNERDAAA